MSNTAIAQLKAAAYALVVIFGAAKAIRLIRDVASEIETEQWSGPGSR